MIIRSVVCSPDLAIIREIYDGENAHEAFENDLERALEADCRAIVVEPQKLGEETAQWISVGNCIHKTALLSGMGSLACSATWPERTFDSVFCSAVYAASWQTDPCCRYQVETDPAALGGLLHLSQAVVLLRRDGVASAALHTTVTLLAVALRAFRVCRSWSSA